MEITWWWRNLFFSFYRARFPQTFTGKWKSKTVNVTVKNKSVDNKFQWFILLSTIKMTWKCENDVKPLACGSWFHLILKHFDVIPIAEKIMDHRKLLSICLTVCWAVIKSNSKSVQSSHMGYNMCTEYY